MAKETCHSAQARDDLASAAVDDESDGRALGICAGVLHMSSFLKQLNTVSKMVLVTSVR